MLAPNAKLRAQVAPYVPEPSAQATPLAECEANCAHYRSVRLATVYVGTPRRLLAMALRSLRTHLFKLRDEGRVRCDAGGAWQT